MSADDLRFGELPYARPALEDLQATAEDLHRAFAEAPDAAARAAQLQAWDRARRAYSTQRSLAEVRFHQDASDDARRAEKEFFDEIGPEVQGADVRYLKAACTTPDRPALEAVIGTHAFALWDCELTTFRPEIADEQRTISRLGNAYSSLLATTRIPFQGEEYTFSTLRGFYGSPDRAVRLAANQAQDTALAGLKDRLDDLYGALVQARHGMARKLGYSHFTPLGYRLLQRTDYGPAEVAAFRQQVREVLVPLAQRIRARQAAALGLADGRYAFPDEAVRDPLGVPRPQGDHDWMLGQAQAMFDAMGEDFSAFFAMMRQRDLLDLKSRAGKTGGGFCTSFEDHGVPFIFANFNGSQDDVIVFTHECGHAFQAYASRGLSPREYLWPTLEACEIHSMGLEVLTYPHMELFFGDDAERFRVGHLEEAITFIPYGAAVDEFQHRVYADPGASADARAAMWHAVEADYLPWRRYEGTPYLASGRAWQRQRHIYASPFYYIDYCLAQLCALQLWSRARTDRAGTMALYRELCRLGGSRPFTALLDAVGLQSPFAPGAVQRIADEVAAALDL